MAAHDHHDHSNCNHDHGEPKKNVVNDEIALRKQAADKLAKVIYNATHMQRLLLNRMIVFNRVTRNC